MLNLLYQVLVFDKRYNRLTSSRTTEIKLNINANHNNTSLNRDEKQRRLETETSEVSSNQGKWRGPQGKASCHESERKAAQTLKQGTYSFRQASESRTIPRITSTESQTNLTLTYTSGTRQWDYPTMPSYGLRLEDFRLQAPHWDNIHLLNREPI